MAGKKIFEDEESKRITQWKRRRNITTAISMFHIFIYTLERACLLLTIPYYLKDSFGLTNNLNLYFGLITGTDTIAQIVGSLIFGRLSDRTKNIRLILHINLIMGIVGNILYTFTFSLWVLLIARILASLNESTQGAMCGEFRRSYSVKEVKTVINRYQMAYSIGINFGPGINVFLQNIKFSIGWWHIDQNNAPALFIAALSTILLIVCFFGVSNSSKEYEEFENFKTKSKESGEKSVTESDTKQKKEPVVQTWRWKDFFRMDLLIISISSGIVRYTNSVGYSLLTLLAVHKYHWSLSKMSAVLLIITSICYVFIFAAAEFNIIQGRLRSFFLYIMSMIIAMFVLILFLLGLSVLDISSPIAQYAYVAGLLVLRRTMLFVMMANGKILMLRTVPVHSASQADGFRNAWCAGLRSIAYFTLSLTYSYPQYLLPQFVLILCFSSVLMLYRRHMYI